MVCASVHCCVLLCCELGFFGPLLLKKSRAILYSQSAPDEMDALHTCGAVFAHILKVKISRPDKLNLFP